MTTELALAYIKQEFCRQGKDYQIEARNLRLNGGEVWSMDLGRTIFFIIGETDMIVKSRSGIYHSDLSNDLQMAHTGEMVIKNPASDRRKIWAVQGIPIDKPQNEKPQNEPS